MMQRYAFSLLVVALFTSSVRAADATFNRDANASWNVATNWLPTNAVPNGVGEWAWLTNNISATRTLTLDANITVGHLTLGDSNNSHGFIINNGTNGSLTLDSTNAQASIVNLKSIAQEIHATMTNKRDVVVDTAGNVTLGGVLTEAGGSYGVTKLGTAMLVLTNANVLTGQINVNGGVLRINTTNSIGPGNWSISNGVLESANDIIRNAGTGSFQMQLTGGEGGFSINGGSDRTVRYGAAGSSITWGSATFNPDVLILNQSNANRALTFDNAIDLNGAARRVDVYSTANIVTMNRVISNGTDFIKGRAGTMRLAASNRWTGSTIVTGGTLRLNIAGALPAGNLALYNGVIELNRDLSDGNRQFGTGAGQIQLHGNSGWGAHEREVFVSAGSNVNPLVWGVDGFANLGALVLNGPNAGGQLVLLNPVDLNGATRTVTVQNVFGHLAGGVTNSGAAASLVKNGAGTLLIAGDFADGLVLSAGNVQLGDYWRTTVALPGSQGNAGTFVTTGGTLLMANPGIVTNLISGSITGAASVTKHDRTVLQFSGTNVYTGTTTINRGTLLLDFGAAGAPTNSIINPGSALTLGNANFDSGTLLVRGGASGPNSQYFRGATFNSTASKIVVDGSAGEISLLLSNLTRNAGATVDFSVTSTGAVFTITTNVNGILGGYATYNGSDWASIFPLVGQSLILPYSDYAEVNAGFIADNATNNVRVAGASSVTSAYTTINTLAITNGGNAATVAMAGGTLRLSARGGILSPPGAGTLTIGSSPNDGAVTAGGATNTAGDVIVINNSGNPTVINSDIINNGSAAITLIKAGTGTLQVAGNFRGSTNSNASVVYANEGVLRMSGTANAISNINVFGGTLWLDSSSSNLMGGAINVNAGTMIVDGPLFSDAALDVSTVAGARARLLISTNLRVSRLRGGANDMVRNATAIIQTGGIVESGRDASGTTIADGLSNYGYYQLAGGIITGNITGTFRGHVVFDVNGGTITPSNNFLLVNNSGQAVLNVRGGSVFAPFTSGGTLRFSGTDNTAASAWFNIFGGTVDAAINASNKALDLMTVDANSSHLNLIGGVLTASQVKATRTLGTSVVDLNGGTLAASRGTTLGTTFMSGLSATYVRPGGVSINVNSNSITIGQALLAPTGHGLVSIPVTTNCGGQFIGPPLVKITGGSGRHAQAIAELDLATGSITNFRVTSPGVDYQASDELTISLLGGGPLVPPTDFTVSDASLAANTSGGLYVYGAGTLTLTNANTYDGTTIITTGILSIAHDTALGSTAGNTIINSTGSTATGGQLSVRGGIVVAENILIQGPGDAFPFTRALDGASGTNTITGTLILNSNRGYRIGCGNAGAILNLGLIQRATNFSSTLIFDPVAASRLNISQRIDNNLGQLTCHGGGIIALYATSNDIGTTVIQNSTTLKLLAENALLTNQNIQIGNGAGNASATTGNDRGFLHLEGVSQIVNSLNGHTNGASGATGYTNRQITGTSTGTVTFSVGSANGSGFFDGVIENGTNGGTLAFTKLGTGTQILSAITTYTGPTRIEAGHLSLIRSGELSGSTSILIAAGATLSVTGRVDGQLLIAAGRRLSGNGTVEGLVLNQGTVAPGASAGTLTITGDYADAGTLDIELESATSNDNLVVTGSSTLAGTLNVSLLNGYIPAGGEVFIIHQATSVAGSFSTTNLPSLPGLGFDVQYLPNAVVLSVTGAPNGYFGYSLQITNPAQRGITDDPDADGYANLLEYATASNPTNFDNNARVHPARSTNGLFALRFNRNINALDVTYIVEGSYAATNDTEWIGIATNIAGSWGTASVTEAGGPNPLQVTVEDTAPPATNRFLRLRVTLP